MQLVFCLNLTIKKVKFKMFTVLEVFTNPEETYEGKTFDAILEQKI